MKGVISALCPSARIIDLCHEVRPQAILDGAFLLWASYRYFPAGTVFLAVIDPGVGTDRKILVVKTRRHLLVAPDNGVLDFVLSEEPACRIYELDTPRIEALRRGGVLPAQHANTFDGRDVFAPLAAKLAMGARPSRLGRPATRRVSGLTLAHPDRKPTEGLVVHVDRFGNVVSNLRAEEGTALPGRLDGVELKGKKVTRWVRNYLEAPRDEVCILVGSSGLVELSVRDGSAAGALNARAGDAIGFLWRS